MDVQTIDQQYGELQSQAQVTIQQLQTLGGKLQAAAQNGDQQAREWLLDLRELALSFRAEQDHTSALLQSIHGLVATGAGMQPQASGGGWGQSPSQQAPYMQQPQPGYAPQPGYGQSQPAQGGGLFGGFLNSGLGRAVAMGAGFGIGDDIIKDIF